MDFNIVCPICESPKAFFVGKKDEYKIFRCLDCEGEFSWPMKNFIDYKKPGGDGLEKFKSRMSKSLRRNFTYASSITFLSLIKKGRILDVGSGLGIFISHARNLGFDTYAMDLSENLFEKSLSSKFCVSKGEDFELPKTWPKCYDTVSALDVLEHTENPLKTGKNAFNHLSDGGYLIFTVPNRERYYYKSGGRIDDFVPKSCGGDTPPYHLTFWRKKTVKVFLEKLGFKNYYILSGGLLWRKNLFIRGRYSRFLSGIMGFFYRNSSKTPFFIINFLEHFGTHLMVFARKGDKKSQELENFIKILKKRLYKKNIPFFVDGDIE